jgi:hypothetical protein
VVVVDVRQEHRVHRVDARSGAGDAPQMPDTRPQ